MTSNTNTDLGPALTALQSMLDAAAEKAVAKWIAAQAVAQQPASPSEWVDVETGAKDVLKCNPRTLARLAQSGVIPSSRVGNRLRLKRADLEAYLAGGAK